MVGSENSQKKKHKDYFSNNNKMYNEGIKAATTTKINVKE